MSRTNDNVHNKDDLVQLLKQAVAHCSRGNVEPCVWLYRNKDKNYFENIIKQHHGMMTVRLKDLNGDPLSPINGRISGLFFSARNQHGQPVRKSPFGPVRLQVRSDVLLDHTPCLYFADFYCLGTKYHYVTLVATAPGTNADLFCRNHLPRLKFNNGDHLNPILFPNPFLFYRANNKLHVNVRDELWIEIFYTEDIQVFKQQQQIHSPSEINISNSDLLALPGAIVHDGVPVIGNGKAGEAWKNPRCQLCNLNPQCP